VAPSLGGFELDLVFDPGVLDAGSDDVTLGGGLGGPAERSEVVTAGGRVICVVGLGDTIAEARDTAYAELQHIDFDGAFSRGDIGHRAIARERG